MKEEANKLFEKLELKSKTIKFMKDTRTEYHSQEF